MAIAHVIKRGFSNVHGLVTRGFGDFLDTEAPTAATVQSEGSLPVATSKGSIQ